MAPIILAWIIVRGHALAWPRGEMTAVVGVIAVVLTLFIGVIDKPGSPSGQISVTWGWWHRARGEPADGRRRGVARAGVGSAAQTPGGAVSAGNPGRGGDGTRPDRNLALELVRVTEAAALASARMVGRGDKEGADQAAVDAMRNVLDSVSMDGIVVIGEGEKDEAPMLYNGEKIGDGSPPQVDIAVDPLEGTRLTALGMPNAISVIALAERGTMFNPGPIVYMEKIAGGPEIADLLDLDRPLPETLAADRRAQGDRHPRRDGRDARPRAPPRGDGAGPRGGRAGAADPRRRRVGGDARGVGQLDRRPAVGDRRDAGGSDLGRGDQMHRRPAARPALAPQRRGARGGDRRRLRPRSKILDCDDLVAGDDVFFSATGVTDGDVLQGVRYQGGRGASTESLVMRSRSGTVRRIAARHDREKLRALTGVRYG